ncbi:MAG: transporter [Actinomycetota bacterium]
MLRRTIVTGVAACVAGSMSWVSPVSATEGGGGHYSNGAEDFMSGALPPQGLHTINYFAVYSAGRLQDGYGNRKVPDFQLTSTAWVPRVIYITKYQILGADWGVQAMMPIARQYVRMNGSSDTRTDMGDLLLDPIMLGWHSKNWHFGAGIDVYLPTGQYDKNKLSNIGRNYWTVEPLASVTYLADNGFEASAKAMYDINTENGATKYASGDEFHVDYAVGLHVGEDWTLGLGGYYYQQVTGDRQDGSQLSTSNDGRAIALGPVVKYSLGRLAFTAKWEHEIEVRNRPQGEVGWFKVGYSF